MICRTNDCPPKRQREGMCRDPSVWTVVPGALLLVGCAASQISVVGNKISQSSFNNIALSSNNSVLGQAVANELVGRGYKVQRCNFI